MNLCICNCMRTSRRSSRIQSTRSFGSIWPNTGETSTVVEYLKTVKKRGGKKLLNTVGFDPTFALVANDPDVVALTH